MAARRFETTLTATTDGSGNCTFNLPGPTGTGADQSAQFTFAIVNAGPGGRFIAQVAAGPRWGPWFGPQPFGPVTYPASLATQIIGSGLVPNTAYELEVIGFTDNTVTLATGIQVPTGTTALVGSDVMIQVDEDTLVPLSAAVFPGPSGLFPSAGYSALRLSADMENGGPLAIDVVWYEPTGQFPLGARRFVLGLAAAPMNGFQLYAAVPHLGDAFVVKVSNLTAGVTSEFSLLAEQTTHPFGMFGGEDWIDYQGGDVVGAGAIKEILSPPHLFGGPATLTFQPPGGGATHVLTLEALDPTGAWNVIFQQTNVAAFSVFSVLVPAAPIRARVHNTSAGNLTTGVASLIYDLSRVG